MIDYCSWNEPGHNAYYKNVPQAVYAYPDIPKSIQDQLAAKMQRRDYDDIAVINRDSIEGAYSYGDLRQMHFGKGDICKVVDRSKWKPLHAERGLVYCVAEHCLIVPTVCRNVSRITKIDTKRPTEEGTPTVRTTKVNVVSEPSTLAITLAALFGVVFFRRKR